MAGAGLAHEVQVGLVAIALGLYDAAVGPSVGAAAAPGLVARHFQVYPQHLRLGDDAGRRLERAELGL